MAQTVILPSADAGFDPTEILIPSELHEDSKTLVKLFAEALAVKLRKNEEKYGYTNNWLVDNWQKDLIEQFKDHVVKGDPLDVALYCAFAWCRKYKLID